MEKVWEHGNIGQFWKETRTPLGKPSFFIKVYCLINNNSQTNCNFLERKPNRPWLVFMLAFYPGRTDQNLEKLVFQEGEKQE